MGTGCAEGSIGKIASATSCRTVALPAPIEQPMPQGRFVTGSVSPGA
jgi:hypothetical protein